MKLKAKEILRTLDGDLADTQQQSDYISRNSKPVIPRLIPYNFSWRLLLLAISPRSADNEEEIR
jgi:hypothetical protein